MAISYQYDAEGFYVGEYEDYGVLPNNATYSKPIVKNGYIPKWNGKKWQDVENHKGLEGYIDGKNFIINTYGALPKNFSLEVPKPTEEEIIKNRIREIDVDIEELEKKAMRPLLAIQAGTSQDIDLEIAKEIELKINELRCERQQLEFV